VACERELTGLPIEKHSIAELLDDPIAGLLMKSDGVNREALECALHEIAHALRIRDP